MKTTGIVRKIDELGRVVLPIEMRKTLNLQIRDEVEIQMQDKSIVIKKYEPEKDNRCVFCASQEICSSLRAAGSAATACRSLCQNNWKELGKRKNFPSKNMCIAG